jgi:hypothetical protein
MDNVLTDILTKRATDHTFVGGGGHPHTFVELYDGFVVPMINIEPDVFSFRSNYYYNASDNVLYQKKAGWTNISQDFNSEDENYVYYNGRSVRKLIRDPDPKNFGDIYYYSIPKKILFGRILQWVRSTNL